MKGFIKYYGTLTLRLMLNVLHIFSIKKNRVLFYSFNGKQFSCNPKQITEYLLKQSDEFEIIWAFKKPEDFRNNIDERIKCIKFRSIKYYYYAKTSRVIVQNVQGFGELSRRRKQDIIQTWHASNGYKKQGKYVGAEKKLVDLYHKDYSYVMSGAESMTLRRARETMHFNGPVISGTPRMDIIINQNDDGIKSRVLQYFDIKKDTKLLLYAPTWRRNREDNNYGLDYARVYKEIKKKYGGDWVILVRLHPNVLTKPDLNYPFTIDATNYPDMQDLLYSVDALISDYSSCIWDFSFTYRPCFLFCSDIDKYGQDREFDIPMKEWHFPIAKTNAELAECIRNFDAENFRKSMELHHKEMGNLEDGHATERVCALITKLCKE